MSEFRQVIENPIVRAGATVIATVGMLGLAGCSSGSSEVTTMPNIGPVLADKTHCTNGAVRPCAALIREKPQQKAAFLNADPTQTTPVAWPLESYGATSGDKLTIVCQVRGEPIYDATGQKVGKHVSTVWDVVEVPRDHLAARRQNQKNTPATSFGYASDLLLDNHGVYSELPACKREQNPAGAPPVK